jgi:chemotaxis protein MotB
MKTCQNLLLGIITLTTFFSACVPSRQFEELQSKQKNCADENVSLKSENQDLTTKLTECTSSLNECKKRTTQLAADSLRQSNSMNMLTKNYDKLNETNELLLSKNRDLLSGNVAENKKLVGDLQLTQEELQRKQDALKLLETELNAKRKNLDELTADLTTSRAELKKREEKVNELQQILARKDSTVGALKKKVSDALLGFENNGLTIQQKNGKVYVSLEERLLFASGSTVVDPKGAEAIKKLAKVLEQNLDINVLIEGHTDNVPYNSAGGAIKDNWDLSVLRATSIVKIISANSKVDPTRMAASGRGEYFPIDAANTAEARKKNRRTEIILTPKLDEILKVLETN